MAYRYGQGKGPIPFGTFMSWQFNFFPEPHLGLNGCPGSAAGLQTLGTPHQNFQNWAMCPGRGTGIWTHTQFQNPNFGPNAPSGGGAHGLGAPSVQLGVGTPLGPQLDCPTFMPTYSLPSLSSSVVVGRGVLSTFQRWQQF